jgi:hypothetical protein
MTRRPKQVRGKRPESGARYSVGYARPPKSKQFRPGQSGNPAGRPKGARNVASLAKLALERRISLDHNGRRRRMTVRELACLRLADKAVDGDLKALDYLLMLANERQPSAGDGPESTPSTEQDVAAIEEFFARWRKKRSNTP